MYSSENDEEQEGAVGGDGLVISGNEIPNIILGEDNFDAIQSDDFQTHLVHANEENEFNFHAEISYDDREGAVGGDGLVTNTNLGKNNHDDCHALTETELEVSAVERNPMNLNCLEFKPLIRLERSKWSMIPTMKAEMDTIF